MLKGMYNSPKGECLIRGSQAVRLYAPRWASYSAAWGGLSSVFRSSMINVRQKDDAWTSILLEVATIGFLNMRQGLGPTSRSALIVGSAMALFEGYLNIVENKVASNVQSPQSDFEELDKMQKSGGINVTASSFSLLVVEEKEIEIEKVFNLVCFVGREQL
ncbi:mitochondrial import inner membrane translocase subunit TIM17-2-like [Olea europaea subsp. europaea]|uniref:Mitochondrial import inner membrane translocase subunit TIM17-2-like n=1 Tax=Olea europaea subsp. europaea TaxID=158383 RepID=A0A8S0U8Z8_OLEEU|nr:mitochondrial import inner membrane translocase subunit TIM17-2-like [Olea europaea subsp. europaea]